MGEINSFPQSAACFSHSSEWMKDPSPSSTEPQLSPLVIRQQDVMFI